MTKLRARRGGWSKNIKENDSSDKTSLRSTINRILHSNLKIYSKPISHRDIKANHATPDPLLGRRRPCDGHEPRPRVTGSNPRGDAEAVQSCSGEFIFLRINLPHAPIASILVTESMCSRVGMADRGAPARRSSALARPQSGKCRTAGRGALAARPAVCR